MPDADVVIVGAGPIGLEVGYHLKRAGLDYVQIDKGQIGSTISWFPQELTFFSSNDRIALAGMPLQTVGQRKATKEEYLAYLRAYAKAFDLAVHTYEEVRGITRDADGFTTRTDKAAYRSRAVVLATGDMARPRRLGIPGEDAPHVSHHFAEPHRYFRKRLLVVGGKNSAVEAALRCWHAGAHVAISYRRAAFDPGHVKYWLLPELEGRIRRGEIDARFETQPTAIAPGRVTLRSADGRLEDVAADFVLLLTGYVADMRLFRAAGAQLAGDTETPVVNEDTMETTVPGLYVAGTAAAGTQIGYHLFIENCHIHAQRIAAALTNAPPPAPPPPLGPPES